MPYIKETCVAGDTIEVCKYYTYRVNVKGEKRAKKEKQTSEAQKKVNQRKAEKELRRLMAANYKNGDVVVRLDFFRRPGGSEEMQPLIEKAIRKLRSAYRRAGKQLKYIYVKEDSEQIRDGCPLSASEVLATRRYSCGSMDNRAKLPKAGSIFHQVCIEDRGNRGKADREKVVPVKKSQKAVCPERGNQIKPVSGAGGRERRVHAGEGQRTFGSF